MRLVAIFVLTFLLSADTTAGTTAGTTDDTTSREEFDKAKCAAVKKKIRHIRSRMRAGYTRAQGERLERQLRKLRKDRRSKCR